MAWKHKSYWFCLRVVIVLLRILPIWAALMWLAYLCDFAMGLPLTKGLIAYSAPLQKRFFVPIVFGFSSLLVMIPFILLRSAIVFRVYATLFLGCLIFMAYDYLVPFHYTAPATNALVADGGGWFAHFSINEGKACWTSSPRFSADDFGGYVPFLGTLILAFIYRRYFLRWAKAEPNR